MFTLHRVFAFLAALVTFAVAGGAHAQTVGPTLKVTKAGVVHSTSRGNDNRGVSLINHADCLNDDIMTFPLQVSGFTGYTLQAWVGSGCLDPTVRTSSSQRQCWLVENTVVSGTTNAYNLDLHVSSMVSGYTTLFGSAGPTTDTGDTGGTGGTSGTTTAGTGGTAASTAGTDSTGTVAIGAKVGPDPSYCAQPNPENVQGSTAITVFFMLVNTSDNSAAASDQWSGTFKLVGPPPPDTVTAGIGGNLLVVNFSYNTGSIVDTTGNGFYLYCDPAPGAKAAVDAGLLAPDAGVGNGACADYPSAIFFKGDPAPADAYRCGSAQKTSSTGNATNLVNGVPYNIAVAAYDTYDNVGTLSTPTCEVPQAVTGFYKAYRDAGGTGGGGFCSFSRKREPLTLVAVLGLASFLVFRRRRAT